MRRRKKRVNLQLDIAPINLIDLLLVLLIFFITTTSFLQLKVIALNLPSSSSQKVSYKKNKMVVISLDKACHIFINQKRVEKKELEKKFLALKNEDKEYLFQVAADRESYNYCLVDLLDILKNVGIDKIAILTQKKN